jgi:PilZ domain
MSTEYVKSDRRKKTRKSPPSLVYVELGSSNGGMLRDLSKEGFAVRAMMPLRPGEKTPFSLVLNATTSIEGQGEVLWIEENGRVAGIRFLEIPAHALRQVQSWLDGTLEASEVEAETDKTVAKSLSFEQLRQELRDPSASPESPGYGRVAESLPPPEKLDEQPTVVSQAPPHVELAPESPAPLPSEVADVHESPPQAPVGLAAFPGIPDFSTTQDAIEITFEALPPAPTRVPTRFPPRKTVPRAGSRPVAEEDVPLEHAAELPEIAQVLIQPPGIRRARGALGSSALEALDEPLESRTRAAASWTEWFTPSRAISIMILLALFVAFSAFHHAVGEGLIWLGEQMGGAQSGQTGQSAAPPPADHGSSVPQNPQEPKATEPSSAAPETGSSPSAGTPQESANSRPRRNITQDPLSAVTKAVQPPVTPLSEIPSVSGSPQEAGLTEYTKALQLLRSRNGGADVSEAIRLLWISVEKGNPNAELTLAELYWHGEGVAHNCDQTRILLSAAARKGNSDAQKRLQQFQKEGCE